MFAKYRLADYTLLKDFTISYIFNKIHFLVIALPFFLFYFSKVYKIQNRLNLG